LIEAAFAIGILPEQLYNMELWEFVHCCKAYHKKSENDAKNALATSWQIAAFTGAAFAGKLKKFDYYAKDEKTIAPKISKEEFDKKLLEIERRAANGAENT